MPTHKKKPFNENLMLLVFSFSLSLYFTGELLLPLRVTRKKNNAYSVSCPIKRTLQMNDVLNRVTSMIFFSLSIEKKN